MIAVVFYDRQSNRRIMVNVVDIADLETLELFAPEPEMVTEVAPVALAQSAEELESGLVADGRVVVDAILFAFDSDRILPMQPLGRCRRSPPTAPNRAAR